MPPFKLQGSSMLVIQPCYDGRVLPITHQVAAEGLALLSIKDSHRDCTRVREPGSKLSSLSCTQGIKPRNSFWNLHKPELRKIKGLDCTTTDSVIELFQTHNVEGSSVKSYRKKVVSKLGSIIYKKSKPATQPQVLVQNVSWPINCCILSSICQEKEMVSPEILRKEEIEKTLKQHDFEGSNSKIVGNEDGKDTVVITLPPSNMHENTSDDLIPISELMNPSNGDSSTNTSPAHFNTRNPIASLGYDGSFGPATSQPVMSSSILLESKQSQHQISIPSNIEFYRERPLKESRVNVMGKSNMLTTNEKNQDEGNTINVVGNIHYQDSETKVVTESPSVAVQSIFSDIFQDMEEIKDVINSYMSSFYVQEEEYNNFPKLYTSSEEVTSHFLEQVHGPLKDKNCYQKNMHDNFFHNVQENAQNECIPELFYTGKIAGNTVSAADLKVQDSNTEDSKGNANKNETEKERSPSYCYWEDNDLGGEFTNGQLAENMDDSRNLESNRNTELVTHEFIENMWEEFTNQIETHALFVDLVNENDLNKFEHESNFPSYGHWANMYDLNILQEAENIVHTLDSLLMHGSFPTDEGNNASYIPCTIVELVDEREDGPNEHEDVPVDRDENISRKQEYLGNPDENEEDSAANMRNKNCTLRNISADETTNRKNIHELKLEPIFYQEKVVQHEIDYSRIPEYEKIQLDPINHEGKVDFSTLQSSVLRADSSTDEINKYEMEEQINKYIPRENKSQKQINEENTVIDEYFFEYNKKSVSTLETNYGMGSLKNELGKDNIGPKSSLFDNIQERNSPKNSNSAFLFSSPTVQLNLTNPLLNTNKK